MDKAMYAVLGVVILLGLWNTLDSGLLHVGGEYNYREGVSLWFRGIFDLPPRPLAHGRRARSASSCTPSSPACCSRCGPSPGSSTSSVPRVGYLTRPYIVYRSRDTSPAGSRPPRRGWDKVDV